MPINTLTIAPRTGMPHFFQPPVLVSTLKQRQKLWDNPKFMNQSTNNRSIGMDLNPDSGIQVQINRLEA